MPRQYRRGPQRPIDKQIKVVNLDSLTNTQQSSLVYSCTYPCTLVGLRWSFTFVESGDSADLSNYAWAIVRLPDGNQASTLALTDAGELYTPEEHVMANGVFSVAADATSTSSSYIFDGSSQTGRKMQVGDVIRFIALGETASQEVDILGTVQFFLKG